ncbi:MAG TPA: hydrophobe/amphiphile efflux-1 family RND transporter [Lentisphaeria bacterium]|nr:MAG: RND transporter [Lentisphaerae bacterium GWF2_38_69]HBM16257.1 hydrophobe/amphiphile efflux-1 family RND transporter [Lentisphaeria bacterium]
MLSKFFIERPRFAFVISIIITIAGLVSISSLPVTQYPDITPSQIQISASYPGASAETILKTVIQPIETQVNGVKNMMYISSTCSDDGTAMITVTFPPGSDGDINTVNVQNKERIAEPTLPKEVIDLGVTVKEKSANMLLGITLFSPKETYDSNFLINYINLYIKDELARIIGVGDVQVLGGSNYSMRIWLNPDLMANLGICVADVTNAIQQQNTQSSAGALGDMPCSKDQIFRYILQTQGRMETVSEFENIIIKALPDGSSVKIKDIAKVELGSENYNQSCALNGKPAALLAVYQLSDANGIQIAEQCRKKLEELKTRFPPDLDYGVQYDTTKFIQASIDEAVKTLFEAVLLVILVTFIFLQDWRATLVPTIAIPVSLIGTFAFLYLIGYSINLITLFALILAIGIVVDDAIVVIESVNRMMEEEKLSPKEAAIKTMELVTSPVIATTLVLLAMFIPICFMPGITGEMYRQFGITISIAVLISSINALTLSPALSAMILKPVDTSSHKKKFFFFRWFNTFFGSLTNGYTSLLSSLVRKAVILIILYGILALLSGKLYTIIPKGFVPAEDQGAFMVNVQLPDAAAMPRTQNITSEITNMMIKVPGITNVIATNGFSIINNTSSSNNAFVIGTLDDWSKRQEYATSVFGIIRNLYMSFKKMPGAQIAPFNIPAIPGLGSTGGFSFVLQDTTNSSTPQELSSVANKIIVAANQRPEIGMAFTTFKANVPNYFLDIDRDKAMKMGVSINEINTAMKGFTGYTYVNDFNKFGKTYKVEIQAQEAYRSNLDGLDNLYVKNSSNDMVPLDTLIIPEMRYAPQFMNRYNLYSSVTINGDAAPGYSSGQAMKAMEEIASTNLPRGYKYEWTDMSYQEKLAGNKTIYIFAFALLFIYLFLVAQYESWMIPMAVMLSVPIAFLGSLAFLWMWNVENNIYTQVGFVILFGLACKTAILIVEFAKEQHEKGMSVFDAAVFAAKLRFRSVLMTSIAFVLGVIPLVVASGAGAISRKSLGTVIFGGMLISCIFGTILVPIFYVLIQKIIDGVKSKKKS